VPVVEVTDALVQALKVGQVGSIRRGECGVETLPHHQAAKVGELLACAGVGYGVESVVVEEGETQLGRAHPEVGQQPLGIRPVVYVGLLHEAGRIRGDGGEGAHPGVELRDVAGDAILPFARFVGSETQHHAAASVPESGDGDGALARGPELGAQFHCGIGMGMRSRGLVAELEDQLARRIGRRIVAPGWVGGGLRGQGEGAGDKQDDREAPTKRHKF
jgi:hypothetical protein